MKGPSIAMFVLGGVTYRISLDALILTYEIPYAILVIVGVALITLGGIFYGK